MYLMAKKCYNFNKKNPYNELPEIWQFHHQAILMISMNEFF